MINPRGFSEELKCSKIPRNREYVLYRLNVLAGFNKYIFTVNTKAFISFRGHTSTLREQSYQETPLQACEA